MFRKTYLLFVRADASGGIKTPDSDRRKRRCDSVRGGFAAPSVLYSPPFGGGEAEHFFYPGQFRKAYADLWYQPNLVGLTPFPKRKEEFDIINTFVKEHENDLKEIDVYRFVDCFDFMPQQISKGAGLAYLGELLHILPEEMVVFGDSSNDYPMFAYAGCAVGIHLKEREVADRNFDTIGEALEWLAERI